MKVRRNTIPQLLDIYGAKKSEKEVSRKMQKLKSNIPKPSELITELNKYIIGQDEAKKALSIAIVNHLHKTLHNVNLPPTMKINDSSDKNFEDFVSYLAKALKETSPNPDEIYADNSDEENVEDILTLNTQNIPQIYLKKSNVLLFGPSGSGKTFIIDKLADILDIPFVKIDISNITAAGYVGESVEDIIRTLLDTTANDVEKAERGIVFLDEVDKIYQKRTSGSVDVGGKEVQNQLLKLIEGKEITVEARKGVAAAPKTVNTKNILFIFGGSFPSLKETPVKKKFKKSIGLSKADTKKEEAEFLESYKVSHRDLIEYGLIPEFVGRVGSIVELKALTSEQKRAILVDVEESPIKQARVMFKLLGKEFPEDKEKGLIEEVLKEAEDLETGARSLFTLLEDKLRELYYE